MAKKWAKSFYSSDAWLNCRNAYIADRLLVDGGLCEVCNEVPGYIVHHIKELTPSNINNPDVTLNLNNLQYVCKKCHDIKHGVFCEAERSYFFDESGQLHPIPPYKNFD